MSSKGLCRQGGQALPPVLVAGFSAAFLFYCTATPSTAAEVVKAKPTPPPATVTVLKAEASELFEQLSYPARVDSIVNTVILAEGDGVISRIYAPLGQRVRRGAKLFAMTHTDPVYQYAPITQTASVAGIVASVEVALGSQVSRGQRLGALTDPTRLKLIVEIPAGDLGRIRRDAEGEFSLPGSDKTLRARVLGISPFVDPGTGTAAAELGLISKESGLVPGQVGQMSFRTDVRQGISIKEEALVYKGKETFVKLVADGKIKQVPVKIGRKQRGQVEVTEGLDPGATVVERASRFVAEGEEVLVQ